MQIIEQSVQRLGVNDERLAQLALGRIDEIHVFEPQLEATMGLFRREAMMATKNENRDHFYIERREQGDFMGQAWIHVTARDASR